MYIKKKNKRGSSHADEDVLLLISVILHVVWVVVRVPRDILYMGDYISYQLKGSTMD